jgi:hypothetical protein
MFEFASTLDQNDLFSLKLQKALELCEKEKNYSRLLSFVFVWKSKPFSLVDHFYFEPLFKKEVPPQTLFLCGRQVGKTMSVAVQQIFYAWVVPGFNRLVVAPLHVHVERLSVDYLRPLIEDSPLKDHFFNKYCRNKIMEKRFVNNSLIRLCSMRNDPLRIRGNPADAINYDEVQDIDLAFTDVINECLSHSKWRLRFYTGTAKTLDNPIEWLWQRSSKAEWCIPCPNCKYENICCTKNDLLNMLGPVRADISEEKPGLVCAKCKMPINPRQGFWVHGNPNKRFDFAGYHIPQPIVPIHYANPRAWADLLNKIDNMVGGFVAFKNEILGESEDSGVKLVTREDLVKHATLGENTDENLAKLLPQYDLVVMGVDWGGGGETGLSRTAVAICGYKNGQIHVLRGIRFREHDPLKETKVITEYIKNNRVRILAYDANPAGSLREILLNQQIITNSVPMQYYGAVGGRLIIKPKQSYHGGVGAVRNIWRIHKSRSLQLLCAAIKLGVFRFFSYTNDDPDGDNLLTHFLAIFEEKVEHPLGEDQYLIQRNPALPDDFVHAVNFAAIAIWETTKHWPEFAVKFYQKMSEEKDFQETF